MLDVLSHRAREGGGPFHVGHDRLEEAVAGGEGSNISCVLALGAFAVRAAIEVKAPTASSGSLDSADSTS